MACGPRAGRRGGAQPDSARVPAGREEEDGPDRQGPPVGGRGEGAPIWAERGKWAGGREEFGPWEKKKKGRGRWAGPAGLKSKGRKKKSLCIFFKLIQTIQFKLKFKEFKFEPNNKQ